MKTFFEPRTVALAGASATPNRPGHQLFLNLKTSMGDSFYPVNPARNEIEGIPCYPSIRDVPVDIDVAIIFVQSRLVPEILETCAEKGIRRVIIESGGFAEAGEEGRALHKKCLAIAGEAGIRLWGPNCMGLLNITQNKILSFMHLKGWKDRFFPGDVSLVVQSGMLSAGFLSQTVTRTPFGLAKIASIGNKMDVDESDILEYLIQDPATRVIGMYLESVRSGKKLLNLCKSTQKPIVILKSGRSAMGAKAAMSHTASLAQNDALVDAALKQARVIRVRGMSELMDVVRCLSVLPDAKPAGNRVGVITFSGGAGVVTADALGDYGMQLANFGSETLTRMKPFFPEWMDPDNPVDMYPAIEKNGYQKVVQPVLEIGLSDPNVDAVCLHIWVPMFQTHKLLFDLDRLGQALRETGKPVVAWALGNPDVVNELKKEFEAIGIPVVDDIDRGVRVLAAKLMRR